MLDSSSDTDEPVGMEGAMRITFLTILGGLAVFADVAQAQDRPPALENAEACLMAQAESAVAVSTGATDAAEFLLNYLCAEPVSAAARYTYNIAVVGSFQAMMGMIGDDSAGADDGDQSSDGGDAVFGSMGAMSVDPTTGHMISPEGAMGLSSMMGASAPAMEAIYLQPTPQLRALAGQLVLEARRRGE